MAVEVLTLDQIKAAVDVPRLIDEIEAAFRAYSEGTAVVAPVGHIGFEAPGDVHIKHGYLRDGDYYVVKIATGFPRNIERGLPASDGLMLLFGRGTGLLTAILLDQGYLTDLRTAVAGAIAAKHLAPKAVERIGIVGTGVQARFQLRLLAEVTDCKSVIVAGRNDERLSRFREEMAGLGYVVETTRDTAFVAREANLIVTTTAAREALLRAEDIRPGTHITAMGADAPGKQELDPELVARADVLVADSRSQCLDHGELGHAVRAGLVSPDRIVELGQVIANPRLGRTSPDQITIADLTGVAVQDLAVAIHVWR